MPFPVDNIRKACAKRNTTLKQLERDLGIGNGVIAKWENAKGSPPYDRIVAIAEHLTVPVSELTGEGQKKEPIPKDGLTELQKEGIDFLLSLSEKDLKQYIRMGKAMVEE